MSSRHPDGFFEALIPDGAVWHRYSLRAANAGGTWELLDPFMFPPVLGAIDDYLLVEGTHRRCISGWAPTRCTLDGVAGVHFAVWAPNARRVSVVGDFNAWDGRRHPMRKRIDSGLWEIFAPAIGEGAVYKFEIIGADGTLQPLKADPFGFAAELRPSTASVVARTDTLGLDRRRLAARARSRATRGVEPMAIYEVHLGSWRRGEDGAFLSYDAIADAMIPYVAGARLHPYRAAAGHRASARRLLGLPADRPVRADPPVRRSRRLRPLRRPRARSRASASSWTGCRRISRPTCTASARFDGAPLYEHADPRRGFHPDWNTAIYDFGRREVANVLAASALYWLDRFHIDGLRVDAVASMLYLDYSRRPGEWVPNEAGGRENRDAVGFLQRVNTLTYGLHPGTVTIAEESTAWPGVSQPVDAGGLGFGFKWNMGWMHDTLDYIAQDPVHRRWHHDKLTFGLLYGFSENFVLPLSHDEVVHGKRSILGRIPGDAWQRAATLRAYYAFMWGHPGKKLLFMGQEFGQLAEWNFAGALDWHLLDEPLHAGLRDCVRDLNRLYRGIPALHARDCEAEGFRWIVVDDAAQSVFAWLRRGGADDRPVAVVCNFTPVPRHAYRIGLPFAGRWRGGAEHRRGGVRRLGRRQSGGGRGGCAAFARSAGVGHAAAAAAGHVVLAVRTGVERRRAE